MSVISCMKREINEDFFKNIDTEEKAYFLGLFFADGCNFIPKDKKSSTKVIISLQEEDKYILEHLNKLIYIKNPKPLEFSPKKKESHQNQYKFITHSKKISNDLSELGAVPRKARVLKFPELENHLLHHFVRGYFDGDGSIYLSAKRKRKGVSSPSFRCSICGTKDFNSRLSEFLNKINVSCRIEEHNNSYILRIIGNQNCIKFLNWIYKDNTLCLKRKNQKYVNLLEINKEIEKKKYIFNLDSVNYNKKNFAKLMKKSQTFIRLKIKEGLSYQEIYNKYGK